MSPGARSVSHVNRARGPQGTVSPAMPRGRPYEGISWAATPPMISHLVGTQHRSRESGPSHDTGRLVSLRWDGLVPQDIAGSRFAIAWSMMVDRRGVGRSRSGTAPLRPACLVHGDRCRCKSPQRLMEAWAWERKSMVRNDEAGVVGGERYTVLRAADETKPRLATVIHDSECVAHACDDDCHEMNLKVLYCIP